MSHEADTDLAWPPTAAATAHAQTIESSPSFVAGEHLLRWIEAYSRCAGNARSCWLGGRKKLVCMSWREADSSEEEGEGEEEEDDMEEGYVDHSLD